MPIFGGYNLISIQLIDILILSFNKVNQTVKCLKSVLSSGADIYILDNGSSEMQLNELIAFCVRYPKIKLYKSRKNMGVAGGRNFLINKSKSPWLLFLDNDTFLWNRNWLRIFTRFINSNPEANILVPKLYNLHNNSFSPNLSYRIENNEIVLNYGNSIKPNLFPGGAVVIKKTIFDKMGYYDDSMLVGFEDFEFGLRPYFLGKGPLEIHLVNELIIIHDHSLVKNKSNINSVMIRYDITELAKSFDRVINKYGVKFNHEYLEWTKLQTEELLSKNVTVFDTIKRLIKMYYNIFTKSN